MKNVAEISYVEGEPQLQTIPQRPQTFSERIADFSNVILRKGSTYKPLLLSVIIIVLTAATAFASRDQIDLFFSTEKSPTSTSISPNGNTTFTNLISGEPNNTEVSIPLLVEDQAIESPVPTQVPKKTSTPASIAVPVKTAIPTPTPTPVPKPTATPRVKNPPVIRLGYPNEQQSISMTPSQTLCAVDTPEGGNTTGLQRRHQHNDGSWTNYEPHFTLCWNPPNGWNTLRVQYRNGDGDESGQITRTFNFTRNEEISYTLTGKVYSDNNCNAQKDAGEEYVNDITTHLFKMPGFVTYLTNVVDTDGTFSHSATMLDTEQASFSVSLYGNNGYKSHPTYEIPDVTFSKDVRSITVESPAVPYQSVGLCVF